MSITTMYDGANNSIYTTLTSTAGSADTTINVVSTANLPTAPNIATIGVTDSAEVVLYAGKTGTSLTGCTRGFGGTTAATWAAGQYVYRAFTKYDHDTFKDNIEDLDTRVGGFQPETSTLTAETTLANDDYVPFLDTSAGLNRKSTWANIVSTIRTLFFGTSNGLLKADGSGGISAAVSNTDYAAAAHKTRHATGGADALALTDIASAGVDYVLPDLIMKIGAVGVYSGGGVTAQGTPDQTVAVAAGVIINPLGIPRSFDEVAALAASAADATNPRIDIVYVTSAGVVTYLAGTAAATPAQPATPSNGTILAAIARAANDNTIATSDITDQADFITIASDFEDVNAVTESSNAFACDLAKRHTKNFSFPITNATAKTVTFTNVPYGTCDVILTIKATGTAAVTWTLDGRTLVWPAGAPTLTTGYTYEILFSYLPTLAKWVGRAALGAAN